MRLAVLAADEAAFADFASVFGALLGTATGDDAAFRFIPSVEIEPLLIWPSSPWLSSYLSIIPRFLPRQYTSA